MKIKFSEYKKLVVESTRGQLLFVPERIQEIFGFPEMTSWHDFHRWYLALTSDMCAYLHVDESLSGLLYGELDSIVKHFRAFQDDPNSLSRWHLIDMARKIKHPIFADTLLKAAEEGHADAVETVTRQTKNYDENQLSRELTVPEFPDTSDDDSGTDTSDAETDTGKKCFIVMVSQGEYSDEETHSVATFTDKKRAKKFVKRLEKVLYTYHPLDDYVVTAEKLLKIHPESIFIQDINRDTPSYHIETSDLID